MLLTNSSAAVAWAQPTAGKDPAAQSVYMKLSALVGNARHG
jgi:hypothetical protein